MKRLIPALLPLAVLIFTACEDEEKIAGLEKQNGDLGEEVAALESELAGVEAELTALKAFPEVQVLDAPVEEGGADAN